MFSMIKNIFSSTNALDMISNGADKLVFTDEEKGDMQLMFLKAYEPFRLAQRFLSLSMFFMLAISYLLAFVVRVGGNIFCEPVILNSVIVRWWVEDAAWMMTTVNDMFGSPFLMSVGFYFAGGAGEGLIRMFKAKK